ncbi:hypothetical protein GCM10022399_08720 [Terrabacter ginsenosidimutans]|uniref:Uncharacterized protein n=1 Tax=Terrabacter ginsenosidimutans TaxID=490575 RepID=A0ABP7CS26_9MICO
MAEAPAATWFAVMTRWSPTTKPEPIHLASQVTTSMRTMAGLASLATSAQLAGLAVVVGVELGESAVEMGGLVAVTVTVAGCGWLVAPSVTVGDEVTGAFAEQAATGPQRATTPAATTR